MSTTTPQPNVAGPTGSEAEDQFKDGITWLAAWLVDHAEREEVTEENVLRWATDAIRGRQTPAHAPVMGWQPIATAPRDGTRVLCAWSDHDAMEVLECHHGCWLRHSGDGNWGRLPAYWMPLPQPPNTKPSGGGHDR